MAEIRIGVSGWRYKPWRGVFYPKDLPQRLELWYASRVFPTIELNGSFYSLQRPEYYSEWHDDTPDDFVFALKGPRFITHMKKLRDIEAPLANFFASGIFNLRAKLGPVLWQFPPNFRYRPELLEAFLKLLPRSTREALTLARRRDARMVGRSRLAIDADRPVRHAIEIRNESFLEPSFVELLRKYGVALVVAETANKWPLTFDVTADFIYMRLHGDKELYTSGYGDKALSRWAARIKAWHRGSEPADVNRISARKPPSRKPRDIYCYFDNTDVKLRAPVDAQSLMRKLGLQPDRPRVGRIPARLGTPAPIDLRH
ncbi:MAG TPA: DUF72 domain-containing protein [Steroidobacter sp.]